MVHEGYIDRSLILVTQNSLLSKHLLRRDWHQVLQYKYTSVGLSVHYCQADPNHYFQFPPPNPTGQVGKLEI